MKTVIIYTSVHHQNTEKVATVMAEELGADLVPVAQAEPGALDGYDLAGFGSGIFFGKHHKTLMQFVETLPAGTGKAGVCLLDQRNRRERDACCPEGAARRPGLLHRG